VVGVVPGGTEVTAAPVVGEAVVGAVGGLALGLSPELQPVRARPTVTKPVANLTRLLTLRAYACARDETDDGHARHHSVNMG